MIRLVASCALLVACVVAQCQVQTPNGARDLSRIPTAKLEIDQEFKGAFTSYTWVINLCDAVNRPPLGIAECPAGAAYVSQYSTTTCVGNWSTPEQPWKWDNETSSAMSSFSSSEGWTATVLVGCPDRGDSPAPPGSYNLRAARPVKVTNGMQFTIYLTSSAVCRSPSAPPIAPPKPMPPSACGVKTPNGFRDLTQVPTSTANITLNLNGAFTTYTFVINLCNPVSQPPLWIRPCQAGPAYISQYSTNQCVDTWETPNTPFSWDDTMQAGTISFGSAEGRSATVLLGCGKYINLVPAGDVVTSSGDEDHFLLLTSAMCPAG